ncbi:hypothetical protein TNCT_82091 [Trichonephila clavata]|uniref:Uncharacterized protein n=1 Tax=Trichonephila clavata TaxID=2740835 RepID=A0A8X6G342_TRICU|nr:hypothetical protein TNCT_82091 [Trichonephila clavata]
MRKRTYTYGEDHSMFQMQRAPVSGDPGQECDGPRRADYHYALVILCSLHGGVRMDPFHDGKHQKSQGLWGKKDYGKLSTFSVPFCGLNIDFFWITG